MIYRQLGNTGLKVSQLGFGAMRLPMDGEGDDARVDRDKAIGMIHAAFAGGVNYIDTAVGYCNRDSQRAVGEALKGWRDRVIVSTKNPYYGEDESAWWQNLQDSLERLDVQTIDIYNHHGLRWQRYTEAVEPRIAAWMHKAKDQGLIRHICCSFHDDNDALRKVVDTGYVDSITLQYNLLDRQLEDGIAYAHDKGVGVVVMGPVGGGALGAGSEELQQVAPGIERVPELALRFVLNNPNVSVALSGMSTMEHVRENLAVASDPVALNAADAAAVEQHLARIAELAKLYCTQCGYCKPCPSGVNIPHAFKCFNLGRLYGLWGPARRRYARILKDPERHGYQADRCTKCGQCIPKCPQNLDIPAQLEEAHAALTAED